MNLKQIIADNTKAAQAIYDKASAENRDLTADEQKQFDEHINTATEAKTMLEKAQANTAKLGALALAGKSVDNGAAENDTDGIEGKDLGERFVDTKSYRRFHNAVTKDGGPRNISIEKSHIGSMDEFFATKAGSAIGTPLAHLPNQRLPMIDQVNRPALTLLDLISRGSTGGDFEYLQVTSVTRNTAIIPENTGDDATDVRKPESTFSTNLETAKVYDYADGYTVTNQMLADDAALASYLQNEFNYSFGLKLTDVLLNGSGTNGEPKGLLNTSGVQAGAWSKTDDEARNLVIAIRKSLTQLHKVGANPTAILINPDDAEKIDLMEDANKRWIGNGPFQIGPTMVWSRPLVECDQIDPGKVIVGDFKQLTLLDRSGLTVEAFNQHKDYASRNLTYVRAELRAAQAVWRPAFFTVLEQGA